MCLEVPILKRHSILEYNRKEEIGLKYTNKVRSEIFMGGRKLFLGFLISACNLTSLTSENKQIDIT